MTTAGNKRTTISDVLARIRAKLEQHGVQGGVLEDLLENIIEERELVGDFQDLIGWEQLMQYWLERDSEMDLSFFQSAIEQATLPFIWRFGAEVKQAVAAGGDLHEALRLLYAYKTWISKIAVSRGPYSVIAPSANIESCFEKGLFTAKLIALVAKVAPRLRISLLAQDGQVYHVLHGVTTTVRLPFLWALPPAGSAEHEEEVRNIRQQIRESSEDRRLYWVDFLESLQSLCLASVLIAAGCPGLGNARLAALRIDTVSTPNPSDVKAWCEAYDTLMAYKNAILA